MLEAAELDEAVPFDERGFSSRVLRAHAEALAIAICVTAGGLGEAGEGVTEPATAGARDPAGGVAVEPTGVPRPAVAAGASATSAAAHRAGRKGGERHEEQREAIAACVWAGAAKLGWPMRTGCAL